MACYTVYLATGSTLLAISIKVDMVKRYLTTAVKLYFGLGHVYPTLTKKGSKATSILGILHEAQQWEKVPNCCEPVTSEMVDYVLTQADMDKEKGHLDSVSSPA